ncbi:MAG: acyl-CoA thioesterase [Anaerobacillus sp.]|uniref:acyl-CoA thioesterase n=1 Tax=Anaerobacillus sp. TaxID=1872506 RepID=UPI00391AF1CA
MHISNAKIEVRYAETDQMGVVYHANYLVWCEIGRTKFIEDIGFKYAQLEKEGILSPVVNVQFSYKYPAKYGETVEVRTWVEDYNSVKVTYGYEIVNEAGKVCVTGTSEHVCVTKESFRPISIKRKYPSLHEAYEKVKKQ